MDKIDLPINSVIQAYHEDKLHVFIVLGIQLTKGGTTIKLYDVYCGTYISKTDLNSSNVLLIKRGSN